VIQKMRSDHSPEGSAEAVVERRGRADSDSLSHVDHEDEQFLQELLELASDKPDGPEAQQDVGLEQSQSWDSQDGSSVYDQDLVEVLLGLSDDEAQQPPLAKRPRTG